METSWSPFSRYISSTIVKENFLFRFKKLLRPNVLCFVAFTTCALGEITNVLSVAFRSFPIDLYYGIDALLKFDQTQEQNTPLEKENQN